MCLSHLIQIDQMATCSGYSGPYCSCPSPSVYTGSVSDFINEACGASDDDISSLSTIYYSRHLNLPLLVATLRRLLNMESFTEQLHTPLAPIDRTSSGRTLPHATSATANQSTASAAALQQLPSQPLVGGTVAAVAAATDGSGQIAVSMGRPPLWLMCIRAPAGVFTYALSANAICGIVWCVLRMSGEYVGHDIGVSVVVGFWLQFFWLCPLLFGWSWFRLTAALAPISGITTEKVSLSYMQLPYVVVVYY